jgi:dCTP deaminase
MLKSDRSIRRNARQHDMINPFSEKQVREGVISYGLSSYGDDLCVGDEFKIFTKLNCTVVDPKNFDERSVVTMRSDVSIVPPNSFALARSVE